jgi:hypothetical protein
MRVRHKVPTVFTLSMVDVLCCALGCVILIWLLNSKMSADEASDAEEKRRLLLDQARQAKEESDALLAAAGDKAATLDARLRKILEERDKALALAAKLSERVELLEKDREALLASLNTEKKEVAELLKKLGASGEKSAKLAMDLKALTERYEKQKSVTVKLDADLAALLARIKATEGELGKAKSREEEEKARAELLKKSLDVKARDLLALTKLLEEARQASGRLRKSLDARDLELAAAKGEKLDLARLLRLREAALADAGAAIKKLEAEKVVLRTAADNRFAGIELTGKRVVFVVDTSGSMVLLDAKTDAPDKWREVVRTVGKLMRSMPDLQEYQVITFASETSYPLKGGGKWIKHDRAKSPDEVTRALEKIKPDGGTNMYAALEQAFHFRKDGLDAIYLLSDGLPNLGEGLTPREARLMSEVEKGTILGRHIRNKLAREWNAEKPGQPRVKIHTIGFFYESPDLGSFLWALARENEGSFVGMSRP